MSFVNVDKMKAAQLKKTEDDLTAAIEKERPADLAPPKEGETPPAKKGSEEDIPAVIDGVNWKDRYGNLQRYIDTVLKPKFKTEVDGLKTEVQGLKTKFETLSTRAAPVALPKSEEDIEALEQENPAAYNAIVKVAERIANRLYEEKTASLNESVNEIQTERKKSREEAAFIRLQKLHPDIDLLSLEDDVQFQSWLFSKSKRFQEALTSQKEDVDAASDVLSLYKHEVLSKGKKAPKPSNEGAHEVAPKSTPDLPVVNSGWDFVESEIKAMDDANPRWFEKNAAAIMEAESKGRILMDIADPHGAARKMAARAV